MMIEALVFVHIFSGTVGLLCGFAILLFKKGTLLHKRIGSIFFYAMMVLGLTGAAVGFARWIPLSALNGLLVCYFVLTSLLTMQKGNSIIVSLERMLALLGAALVVSFILFGKIARSMPEGMLGGFDSIAYFVFGSVAAFAVASDVHYLLKQNHSVRARLIRHLWRMLFPLFMATAAFFLGQAKLFPAQIQQSFLIFVPVIIVIAAMLFWVARVYLKRTATIVAF
jgi:hypothetical protein